MTGGIDTGFRLGELLSLDWVQVRIETANKQGGQATSGVSAGPTTEARSRVGISIRHPRL